MKKIILTFVALVAMTLTVQAQFKVRDYYENSKSIELSNSERTVYIDGIFRELYDGKKKIGIVAFGKDKHGNWWCANTSNVRVKCTWWWFIDAKVDKPGNNRKTEIMDPQEISRMTDPKGNPMPKSAHIPKGQANFIPEVTLVK